MSTPADKVLRKYENKINLGEFLKYISSLGHEEILQKYMKCYKILLDQEISIFSVTDWIMLGENKCLVV